MQAGAGGASMNNLAEIEPVLQKMELGTATERLIPHDTPFLRDMAL